MPIWNYLPSYTIPLSAALGLWLGGAWTFLTPAYVFVLIPLLERLAGVDPSNHDPETERRVKASRLYSALLWSYVPIQIALTAFFLWRVWSADPAGALAGWLGASGSGPAWEPLTGWALAGAILSVGVSNGGTGITVAHELIHRASRFEQVLGRILLLTTFYMHFAIEHVYGHHKHVATEHDPATARRGESFYRFWLRTVPAQYASAWAIERRRLAKKKQGLFSWHNEMAWFHVWQAGLLALIAFGLGWGAALAFLGTCLVAFSLLEAVNYLEHYGLERHEADNGRYEKVDHHHSWNSDHVVSRMFLFELSRHSDHHATASRKYQVLRSFEESPQLPTGYPGMILLALVPPVWFRVMNPLVDRFQRR